MNLSAFTPSEQWHIYCLINPIMIRYQRTIKRPVICSGIGLHTGTPVTLTLKPAPTGAGVSFVRTDLGGTVIKAVAENTAATGYATTLCSDGASVQTVEHLLAALAGLHIDNVAIDIDAGEVPIMDGSARPFIRGIVDAGIETQTSTPRALKILRPLVVRDGDRHIAVWPAETLSISCFIDFKHPLLRSQSFRYKPSDTDFLREISDARTFGFVNDVETLRRHGLARGASLDNVVALDETSVVNVEGLRYKDEFVRHKILDLVGDLSLAGADIIGHVVAHKSGHGLHARLVRSLLNSPDHWLLAASNERLRIHEDQPGLLHAAI